MKRLFVLLLFLSIISSSKAQVKLLIFVDNELILPQFVSELSVITEKNDEFIGQYHFAELQIPGFLDKIDPETDCLVSFKLRFKMESVKMTFTVASEFLQTEYLVVRFYSFEKYKDKYLFSEGDYVYEYDSPLGSTRLIQKE